MAAADNLGEAVATFEAAHRSWRQAIAKRDRVERHVEQVILQATGRLELRRLGQVSNWIASVRFVRSALPEAPRVD